MSVGNIKTNSDCTSPNPFPSTSQTGTDSQFFKNFINKDQAPPRAAISRNPEYFSWFLMPRNCCGEIHRMWRGLLPAAGGGTAEPGWSLSGLSPHIRGEVREGRGEQQQQGGEVRPALLRGRPGRRQPRGDGGDTRASSTQVRLRVMIKSPPLEVWDWHKGSDVADASSLMLWSVSFLHKTAGVSNIWTSNLISELELPSLSVTTFIFSFLTDERLSNKRRELGWRLRYTWQTSCLSSNP